MEVVQRWSVNNTSVGQLMSCQAEGHGESELVWFADSLDLCCCLTRHFHDSEDVVVLFGV